LLIGLPETAKHSCNEFYYQTNIPFSLFLSQKK